MDMALASTLLIMKHHLSSLTFGENLKKSDILIRSASPGGKWGRSIRDSEWYCQTHGDQDLIGIVHGVPAVAACRQKETDE